MRIEELRRLIAARAPVRLEREGARRAAVLVPLVARAGDADALDVLLTLRTSTTPTHAGQISFPGGSVEPSDTSAIDTALRETEEELGIARAAIEVIGELDGVVTSMSNFAVTPIAGYLSARPEVRMSPAEVADVIYVPFEVFESGETMEIFDTPVRKGVISYRFGEVRVWGATARILKQLADLLHPGPL